MGYDYANIKPKYLVYPGHGIGEVVGTETKTILGATTQFTRLRILDSNMIILFPTKEVKRIGIRKLNAKAKGGAE